MVSGKCASSNCGHSGCTTQRACWHRVGHVEVCAVLQKVGLLDKTYYCVACTTVSYWWRCNLRWKCLLRMCFTYIYPRIAKGLYLVLPTWVNVCALLRPCWSTNVLINIVGLCCTVWVPIVTTFIAILLRLFLCLLPVFLFFFFTNWKVFVCTTYC